MVRGKIMSKGNLTSVGVVILNYLAYEESINVTQQFLRLPSDDINLHIVIVDNHSNNQSYNKLYDKFNDNQKVTIVKTNKNLGFANSNNYGYFELTKHIKPDFVIFSNSDIVLKDDRLFEWITNNYKSHNFAVLGPSIYSLQGEFHQNPCNNRIMQVTWNRRRLYKLYLKRGILYIYKILPILRKIRHIKKLKKVHDDWGDYKNYTESKTLHGSFLVMSKKYFEEYKTPFDTGTFLYLEEDILKYRCLKKNLRMVYSPEYEVDHKQAVSTKKVDFSELNREIIRKNNEINSLKRYIKVIREK